MRFGELRQQFPELIANAIVASDVHDDSEVTVVEDVTGETPVVVTPPKTEEEKDKKIQELETQLTEVNKSLAEMLRGKDKDTNTTNITIALEGAAKAGKRGGTNPLTLAYLKRKRK